jgi:hypothetical protein
MTLVAFADHEPRRDIEGSEQRGGSVAYIAVGPALRHAGHHWQDGLLAIQRLDLALLIDAEDKRPAGRRQIKADNIADLVDEQRIVGQFESL